MSAYTEAQEWCARVGNRHYVATSPLHWDIGRKDSGLTITVPVSFVFDVSVPWYAVPFFSPHDPRFLKAACIHDYLLHVRKWDGVEAGATFSSALRADGVTGLERWVMWQAVSNRRFQ